MPFLEFAHVEAVLLDIEGTTTSISFVKETLFPFVKDTLANFLDKNWDTEELRGDLQALREQITFDLEAGDADVPRFAEESEAAFKKSVIGNVTWQMDRDRKTTALKQLQGSDSVLTFEMLFLKLEIFEPF